VQFLKIRPFFGGNKMNRSLATATLAAAIGLALGVPVMPAHAQAQKDAKPMTKEQKQTMERMVKNNLEMCYGVAARGKNDCAEGQHSCVGQATRDRDPESFVLVPKGDCQKLAGGKTKSS
jgi:uncharacterized membrane protein